MKICFLLAKGKDTLCLFFGINIGLRRSSFEVQSNELRLNFELNSIKLRINSFVIGQQVITDYHQVKIILYFYKANSINLIIKNSSTNIQNSL